MTPWDRRVFAHALAATLLAFGLVVLVTAATDAGATFARRIVVSLPAAPLASGFGAFVALSGARRRRELVALELAGASPLRVRTAAWLGAWMPGALAAALALHSAVDVSVYYPSLRSEATWAPEPGGFRSEDLGVSVTAEGAIRMHPPPAATELPEAPSHDRPRRIAATWVLSAMAAAWAAALASSRTRIATRALALATASLAITLLFQLVAANRLGPVAFVVVAFAAVALALAAPTVRERVEATLRSRAAGLTSSRR